MTDMATVAFCLVFFPHFFFCQCLGRPVPREYCHSWVTSLYFFIRRQLLLNDPYSTFQYFPYSAEDDS